MEKKHFHRSSERIHDLHLEIVKSEEEIFNVKPLKEKHFDHQLRANEESREKYIIHINSPSKESVFESDSEKSDEFGKANDGCQISFYNEEENIEISKLTISTELTSSYRPGKYVQEIRQEIISIDLQDLLIVDINIDENEHITEIESAVEDLIGEEEIIIVKPLTEKCDENRDEDKNKFDLDNGGCQIRESVHEIRESVHDLHLEIVKSEEEILEVKPLKEKHFDLVVDEDSGDKYIIHVNSESKGDCPEKDYERSDQFNIFNDGCQISFYNEEENIEVSKFTELTSSYRRHFPELYVQEITVTNTEHVIAEEEKSHVHPLKIHDIHFEIVKSEEDILEVKPFKEKHFDFLAKQNYKDKYIIHVNSECKEDLHESDSEGSDQSNIFNDGCQISFYNEEEHVETSRFTLSSEFTSSCSRHLSEFEEVIVVDIDIDENENDHITELEPNVGDVVVEENDHITELEPHVEDVDGEEEVFVVHHLNIHDLHLEIVKNEEEIREVKPLKEKHFELLEDEDSKDKYIIHVNSPTKEDFGDSCSDRSDQFDMTNDGYQLSFYNEDEDTELIEIDYEKHDHLEVPNDGYQISFYNENEDTEVSRLTLSAEFSSSYNKNLSDMQEVVVDIDIDGNIQISKLDCTGEDDISYNETNVNYVETLDTTHSTSTPDVSFTAPCSGADESIQVNGWKKHEEQKSPRVKLLQLAVPIATDC